MAKLSLGWLEIPSARLGSENPHPSLEQKFAPNAHFEGADYLEDFALPYPMLDDYDRDLQVRPHRVAILESDRLKATFLLDQGGRLWSLLYKPTGQELVHVNPVFQPANFAIRNAWFSGGIEWNFGLFGHSAFTCSPVFAAKTKSPDGSDGLRIWEYERQRGTSWQVDFWAPDGSDFLYWSPRITNPHAKTIPMYWWTCIAVNEEPGGRVLAPALTAMEPDHSMGAKLVTHSLIEEPDLTYPQRRDLPHDTYFDIQLGERPWVAHVNSEGNGVIHISSEQLIGRKQWVWGMEPCGRRWQNWLSHSGPPYIEIQGGLASRQHDYVAMPAHATWNWLEAFGPICEIPSSDWNLAVKAVAENLGANQSRASFEKVAFDLTQSAELPPEAIIHQGSGWGALESARRNHLGIDACECVATPFPPESITQDQRPWLELLKSGTMSLEMDDSHPGSYVGPEWIRLLENSSDKCWQAWNHLGFAYFQKGDFSSARSAWEKALPSGWAHRNLALLDRKQEKITDCIQNYVEAVRSMPSESHLIDEVCRVFSDLGAVVGLEQILSIADKSVTNRPRIRLARAQVALHNGKLQDVLEYFSHPFDLIDIREAETTHYDLWRRMCEIDQTYGNPLVPPEDWDFRMKR